MLLLHHTGRKSGQPRRAVLEVVGHDRENDTYYVVAGFGPTSQWYQNLLAKPDTTIQVGRRKLEVYAERAAPEKGAQVILDLT